MKTFTYFPASKKLQKWPAAELSTSPLVIFLFFQPPPTHCEFLLSWLCFFGVDLFTYLFFSSGLCLSVCEYLGESTLEGIWYSLLPASVWIATAAPGGQGIHICRSHTSQNIVFLKTPSTHSHTTSAQTIVHSLNPQNQWTHKYWKKTFHTQASNTDRLLLHMRTSLQTFSCMHECNTMMSRHSMWIRKREEWFYHFTTIK